MGMVETIIYGVFSVFALILAGMVLLHKPWISLLLGLITPVLLVLCGYNWRLALIDSGKNPAMLGYARYPFALITLIILAVLALLFIAASIFLMIHRKKNAH